jgi:chromosome segregation protein
VRLSGRLEALRDRSEARGEENLAVRAALAAHRADTEEAALRARELARETARREGERASAQHRRQEAVERLRELAEREARLDAELGQLAGQAELWEAQAREARARAGAAEEAGELVEQEILALRARELAAREALRAAEDLLSRLTAQVEAREALERGYEGFSPAVAALMSARARFPGVHGPLADFVGAGGAPAHGSETVEAYLGPLLQAVVVDDLATARALRRWFREEWTGGGSLLLLPLRHGDARAAEPLSGPRWVEALLADLDVVSGDALEEYRPGVARVGPDGDLIDARGVVRLQAPNAGEGILARREALARLRAQRDRAGGDFERAREERASAREALELARERAREAEELRRAADAEARRTEMDAAAHRQRGARLQQEREAARAARAAAAEARRAAEAGIEDLSARLALLAREVEEANERDAALRGRLAELEGRWEQARDEESELRVAVARAESDLREADHRLAAAEQGAAGAAARTAAIDREAAELRATLEARDRRRARGIGPVNMLAVEEHEEEERRLDFLLEQRDDLVRGARRPRRGHPADQPHRARGLPADLRDGPRELPAHLPVALPGRRVRRLARRPRRPAGVADRDPGLAAGKRTQRIHLLSGGERTLTALALLFALYLVKPSPFCLLDEVDAPLDESNVGRFIQLLHDFKRETQFIVITHNPRTMEAADWVYGVTMEEPGVSSIVGVELLGSWTLEDRVA